LTDIVYDTEFHEDGSTIDLISIGMINRATGAQLYLVNADANWQRIARQEWLCRNVVPHLPLAWEPTYDPDSKTFNVHLDYTDTRVVSHDTIAHQVAAFILAAENPRLCAWYGSYDHVVLSQLWGPMIAHPDGVPMWTWDFRQELDRLGLSEKGLPRSNSAVHDALADARELLGWMDWADRALVSR
jgi:hypothetical protein